MTVEKYVNHIIQKIRCSKGKRTEIKQQLLSDISAALENGETFEDILKRMGSAEEVVKEFNQNLSEEEERAYRKGKRMKIFFGAGLVIAIVLITVYWFLPKVALLEDGATFEKEIVEEQVKVVIEELDNNQFEQLKGHAIKEMQNVLTQDTFDSIKEQIAEDWGKAQSMGAIYMAEMKQQGQVFVITQVVVVYENTNVTYTITFDKDMNLAGIYLK